MDRTEACRMLGISRQTLIAWIQKGKLKVWKRVGHGTNAALLFDRTHLETLRCVPNATASMDTKNFSAEGGQS
ncbi:MAG: helix-turn-helix domain-containing protein [Elusimicrobiota bacterium]